jgi:hypothetical protein
MSNPRPLIASVQRELRAIAPTVSPVATLPACGQRDDCVHIKIPS